MRFTLRKVLKVVSFLSFLLMTNLIVAILVNTEPHSDTPQPLGKRGFPDKFVDSAKALDAVNQVDQPIENEDSAVDPNGRNHRKISSLLLQQRNRKAKSDDKFTDIKLESNVNNRPQQQHSQQQQQTELNDIFISVKTTGRYHESRLSLLLETWVELARPVTHFFSDSDDPEYKIKTGGRLINTNCPASHNRQSLCCKLSVEYDTFVASGKRWFCHVDDDTYVNVPALIQLLQIYNHSQDWYLGKPSLHHPVEITDPRDSKGSQKTAFWFATGGAGFCISRGLALKMVPYTGGGKLQTMCDKIRLPDDVTLGFIIHAYLKKTLTVIPQFHSHLEGLWPLKPSQLEKQITLSYSLGPPMLGLKRKYNVVPVQGYSEVEDPTRFKSIHCHLFPYLPKCAARTR